MSHKWKPSLRLPYSNGHVHKSPPNYHSPLASPLLERPTKWLVRPLKPLLALIIFLLLIQWNDVLYGTWARVFAQGSNQKPDNPILNRTLGFQNLFMLSIPDRSDRRAPLLAGANATNLTITILDAIRDRQIPETDWPEGWGKDGWTPKEGELGCLMSHLRTWRKIIHENITSALIMESDVDWDMRIKQSMVGVGKGTRAVADWPFEDEASLQFSPDQRHPKDVMIQQARPYGDKWDLIWLGHCGSAANGDGRTYKFNDSSAPDNDHVWVYGPQPTEGHWTAGTRMVYHLRESVCTTAYAISNQGARKFEKNFREANSPIDMKMWDACANDPKLACIGVYPQVISMTESRTNIKHTEGGLSFGHEITEEKIVAGKSIQVSSRVNADLGLADKGPQGWKWEWKSDEKTKEGRMEKSAE